MSGENNFNYNMYTMLYFTFHGNYNKFEFTLPNNIYFLNKVKIFSHLCTGFKVCYRCTREIKIYKIISTRL